MHKSNCTGCTSCNKGAFKTYGELFISEYEECEKTKSKKSAIGCNCIQDLSSKFGNKTYRV